jgi:hypothetical protein
VYSKAWYLAAYTSDCLAEASYRERKSSLERILVLAHPFRKDKMSAAAFEQVIYWPFMIAIIVLLVFLNIVCFHSSFFIGWIILRMVRCAALRVTKSVKKFWISVRWLRCQSCQNACSIFATVNSISFHRKMTEVDPIVQVPH